MTYTVLNSPFKTVKLQEEISS